MECKECHHSPSGRFDLNSWECYCKCHDIADAAPELLAACEQMIQIEDALTGRGPLVHCQGQAMDGYMALANFREVANQCRAVIAKAKGVV